MQLSVAILTLPFVFLIPSVSASLNRYVECPNELFHQKIICQPGQALSSVTWDEKTPNCRQFHGTCLNATPSCFEESPRSFGDSDEDQAVVRVQCAFVLALRMESDVPNECHCHYRNAVCPWNRNWISNDGGETDCRFPLLSIGGAENGYSRLRWKVIGTRWKERAETVLDHGASDVFFSSNLPIKATYCPVLNIPTCPPDKIQTNLEGGSFPVPGGTTGGAGAGGIATLINPQLMPLASPWFVLVVTQQVHVRKSVSNSRILVSRSLFAAPDLLLGGLSFVVVCPHILPGYATPNSPGPETNGVTSLQACKDICKNDPACTYLVYLKAVSGGACRWKRSPAKGLAPNPGAVLYVPGCLLDAVPQLRGHVPCYCA